MLIATMLTVLWRYFSKINLILIFQMALFCSIGSASVLSTLVSAEHRTKEFSRKLIKRVKSNLNDEKISISTSFVEGRIKILVSGETD
jgi:hypothetical protein